MGKIFHYCTVETLKCILQNTSLRLSDIRKSNDSKEIAFLFEEYMKWVLHKNGYSEVSAHNMKVLAIEQKIQLENTVFMVFCLSGKEDDLHMWSCYGNRGVSIEFESEELDDYIKKIRVGMTKEQKESKLPSGALVLEFRIVEYFGEKNPIEDYFVSKKLTGVDDFKTILDESPFIKSDFFEDEDESRIVYTYYTSAPPAVNNLSLTDDDGNVKELINFKSAASAEYQHKMVIDIPIDINLIKSVRIAPNSTLSVQDVEELFFIYGIKDINVMSSSGSLV